MHNTFINEVKSRQRHGGDFRDVEEIELMDDSDETAEWQFARERLIGAMHLLPERDRRIIEMRMTGVSYREISARLNMNEGTVKSAINRIKKRLYYLVKIIYKTHAAMQVSRLRPMYAAIILSQCINPDERYSSNRENTHIITPTPMKDVEIMTIIIIFHNPHPCISQNLQTICSLDRSIGT